MWEEIKTERKSILFSQTPESFLTNNSSRATQRAKTFFSRNWNYLTSGQDGWGDRSDPFHCGHFQVILFIVTTFKWSISLWSLSLWSFSKMTPRAIKILKWTLIALNVGYFISGYHIIYENYDVAQRVRYRPELAPFMNLPNYLTYALGSVIIITSLFGVFAAYKENSLLLKIVSWHVRLNWSSSWTIMNDQERSFIRS